MIAALRWAEENLDELKGLSGAELGRKYGLRPQWKAGPLGAFLKPFLRDGRLSPKHRWDLMNFKLPSRDLERIWRLPRNLAAGYRWTRRLPPPKWRYKPESVRLRFKGRRQLQAYHQTVKTEERKAARHFAQASGCEAGGKTS
jgi:hypothetical protein